MTSTAAGTVPANGLELAYETFGERGAPPVLMIMGLGAQLIAWPDLLCQALADRGHYLVRFDNRDVGLSTHLTGSPPPRPVRTLLGRESPPYRIEDMADDAAGLLGALGLESAHVVGASMGGFIAQALAIGHPARVRSLTLIMTSTGSRLIGLPAPRVMARLARRRTATDRSSAIAASVETFRLIGSPAYAFDEEYLSELAGRAYDRGYDFDGYRRQLAAVGTQHDRTRALGRVAVPTVVLHGLADPLVSRNGGVAVARAIPGSRFVGYAGMGHDLPRDLLPEFIEEIATVAASGEAARGA